MSSDFLLYGATGFVGEATARMAVQSGMRPVLGGRSKQKIERLATELSLEHVVIDLDNSAALDSVLAHLPVVLNCAGPFIHTYKPVVDACLRTSTHYLDITGEIPVYQAIAERDAEAKEKGIMLLPGIGFDVVPTDCLAVHLKRRLPSATHLTLAFQSVGPAGLPPGTQRTLIELIPFGNRVRVNGQLEVPKKVIKTLEIDFGSGPKIATRITWGDVFTAYHSTGIPNIEDYLVLPESAHKKMTMLNRWRPLFKLPFVRNYLKRGIRSGPTAEARSKTFTHVWGEVEDDQGRKVTSRLHGPEAGVIWTVKTALAGVSKILTGAYGAGFQTPGMAYGPDFVFECEGVTREDIS